VQCSTVDIQTAKLLPLIDLHTSNPLLAVFALSFVSEAKFGQSSNRPNSTQASGLTAPNGISKIPKCLRPDEPTNRHDGMAMVTNA